MDRQTDVQTGKARNAAYYDTVMLILGLGHKAKFCGIGLGLGRGRPWP